MFFNWMVTAWHAVITRFDYDDDLQETLDNWAFLVFLVAYGLFLVVFVSLVLITVRILHTINLVVIHVSCKYRCNTCILSTFFIIFSDLFIIFFSMCYEITNYNQN